MASKVSFTPGPWVADGFAMENDNLVHVCTYDGTENYYHNGASICECRVSERGELSKGERFIGVSEAEANARLISAAPELFEVAKLVLDLESLPFPTNPIDDEQFNRLQTRLVALATAARTKVLGAS